MVQRSTIDETISSVTSAFNRMTTTTGLALTPPPPRRTFCEESSSRPISFDNDNNVVDDADQFQLSSPPPQMTRGPETFSEKFVRKFKAEPLVPIGFVATTTCLLVGIKSFYDRDSVRQQKMMRARVYAQFFTVCAFMYYAGPKILMNQGETNTQMQAGSNINEEKK